MLMFNLFSLFMFSQFNYNFFNDFLFQTKTNSLCIKEKPLRQKKTIHKYTWFKNQFKNSKMTNKNFVIVVKSLIKK